MNTAPSTGRMCHRILVVDDHADSAEGLAFLLRLHGHEAKTAGDGAAALDLARTFHPDVVLLDIGLPQMSGYEVAQRLRGELANAVCLVALTGHGHDQDRRQALEAGFDHFLLKPISVDALSSVLAAPAPSHRPVANAGKES